MKKILLFILVDILPVFIIYVIAMAISLWFTSILFNNSTWFQSRLHPSLTNINSLLSFSLAIFSGEGFIYMVWCILFLPLFWGATTLFDKYIKLILHKSGVNENKSF